MNATPEPVRVGLVGVLKADTPNPFRPVQVDTDIWLIGFAPAQVTYERAVDMARAIFRITTGRDITVIEPYEAFANDGGDRP